MTGLQRATATPNENAMALYPGINLPLEGFGNRRARDRCHQRIALSVRMQAVTGVTLSKGTLRVDGRGVVVHVHRSLFGGVAFEPRVELQEISGGTLDRLDARPRRWTAPTPTRWNNGAIADGQQRAQNDLHAVPLRQ